MSETKVRATPDGHLVIERGQRFIYIVGNAPVEEKQDRLARVFERMSFNRLFNCGRRQMSNTAYFVWKGQAA